MQAVRAKSTVHLERGRARRRVFPVARRWTTWRACPWTPRPASPYHRQRRCRRRAESSTRRRRSRPSTEPRCLAHATLEPQNCTVLLHEGQEGTCRPCGRPPRCPTWHAAPRPDALGLASDRVTVEVTLLGGGFGRRLDVDFIAQAAAVARQVPGVPVQTFWSARAGHARTTSTVPARWARLQAGLDARGRVVAWRATSAGPAIVPQMLSPPVRPARCRRLRQDHGRRQSYDQPYEWPARAHRPPHRGAAGAGGLLALGRPQPPGLLQGSASSTNAQRAAGQDPVAYRAALLQRHPRHLRVLQAVAVMSGWGGTDATGARRRGAPRCGVALHHSFGTIVAHGGARSRWVPGTAAIRVHRVWCAHGLRHAGASPT